MGAGASFESQQAALDAGKTQEEIDAWLEEHSQAAHSKIPAEKPPHPLGHGLGKGVPDGGTGDTLDSAAKPTVRDPKLKPKLDAASSLFDFCTSHKGRLTKSNVFCRIRPFAAFGGHAETDEVQAKHLESWDTSSVTVATQFMFSKGKNVYDFPRHVFPPEATQDEVFAQVAPPVVDALTRENGGCNVVMFAYGQTGTGKTYTMFGPDASLASGVAFDENWGLFPRLVHAVFQTLGQRSLSNGGNTKFILTASGIEFYLTLATDLLDGNKPVLIDRNHKPTGQTEVRFNEIGDLMPFLVKVRKNRTSRSTSMNSKTDNHDGSSRSHAALILKIRQLNVSSGLMWETRLTLLDLAGAERPSKKVKQSAKQKKADQFVTMLTATGGGGDMRGYEIDDFSEMKISTNAQAAVINFELTTLSAEIRKAGENHRKGKKYSPPLQNCPDMIKFLGSCFTGKELMSLMVALSPSGNNGWETWFSCQYGTDLSKLSAPVKPVKQKKLESVLKNAEKTCKETSEKLAKNLKSNHGSALKYRLLMQCQAKSAENDLNFLKMLLES